MIIIQYNLYVFSGKATDFSICLYFTSLNFTEFIVLGLKFNMEILKIVVWALVKSQMRGEPK